ncbi:protein ligase RNF181 [Seminavis robusta]|uniref:RING-type E3 ubiquitin transferase n=1 Tax=Seminavis robusta TaxID=568900 RepID=A0A9N8DKI1_9STRA|nr:protein ligase RNF181 [Seminavis robusta]|eukprot:Sro194_g082920.1 protein ligase RNF181 (431) ;mRNA; r:63776-65068
MWLPFGNIVLLCCLLLALLPTAEARRFRVYCELADLPTVTLERRNGRWTRPGAENNTVIIDGVTVELFGEEESLSNNPTNTLTLDAKICSCWDSRVYVNGTDGWNRASFYCPAHISHCGIPFLRLGGTSNELPGCVNVSERTNFVRSVWPLLVISFFFLLSFLLMTMRGRDAMSYCMGLASPQWNKWRVEHMIDQRPDRANGLMLRYFRWEQNRNRPLTVEEERMQIFGPWGMQVRFSQTPIQLGREEWELLIREPQINPLLDLIENQQAEEEDAEPLPHSLKLRTRIYQKIPINDEPLLETPENDTTISTNGDATTDPLGDKAGEDPSNGENSNEPSCTICYLAIEDGDRVGALECDHMFHVDCLKVWLTRRNVCPLCLCEDIATPQYNESPESPGAPGDETVENESNTPAATATTTDEGNDRPGESAD